MCWSLSPVFVKKRRREAWAIEKKIWTHEAPNIKKKERKKCGHMKVHKKEKKKDGLKRIYTGREIKQKEFPFHP